MDFEVSKPQCPFWFFLSFLFGVQNVKFSTSTLAAMPLVCHHGLICLEPEDQINHPFYKLPWSWHFHSSRKVTNTAPIFCCVIIIQIIIIQQREFAHMSSHMCVSLTMEGETSWHYFYAFGNLIGSAKLSSLRVSYSPNHFLF